MTRKVNIQVTEEVWAKLNSMKTVGDTFDDVLRKVLNIDRDSD